MPISDAPSTSRRLLALLSLLQSRRDWPAPVLAARLGVSERTIRRDIDRLRELDYAIESSRGSDGGYRLGAGSQLPPLLLDDEQAVAVAIALRAAPAAGAGIEEAADRALQTIHRILPSRLAHRIAGVATATASEAGAGGTVADAQVLLRIGDAIRAQEELRFDYTAPGAPERSDPAPRRLEPHHLVLVRGRWYVLGWSPEHAGWRIFRPDRMSLRSHAGRRFERREIPGGDPVAFLEARFRGSGAGREWPCRGQATLDLRLRDVLPYLADGSVEELSDGRCRVQLGSWSWIGLAATLLRFDGDVSDIEPVGLRVAFAELRRRAEVASAGA